MLGLVVALGRLAMTAWTVALKGRLGHYPTEQEWADELEHFELSKLEQHQDPEDPIRLAEADEDEDATPCLTDAEIAAMLEAMHYPPGVKPPPPPPLPDGRVLVHNFPPLVDGRIVVRQRQGVNGFRFWLQDRSHPAGPQVEPCDCGFAPEHETHYRVVES